MKLRLNGWQRLWVVASLLLLILFSGIGALLWPAYGSIKESKEIEAELTTEAQQQIAKDGQPVDVQVEMPDGYIMKLKPGIETKKSTLAVLEYMSLLNTRLAHARVLFALKALAVWLMACAAIYLSGWSVGWVRRGFKPDAAAL